jgi:hypothetical protein
MTSSTRLPNTIFNRAPGPVPIVEATFSVAYVSIAVSGNMATAFNAKSIVGFFNPARCAAIPKGTNTSRTFRRDRMKICLIESRALRCCISGP